MWARDDQEGSTKDGASNPRQRMRKTAAAGGRGPEERVHRPLQRSTSAGVGQAHAGFGSRGDAAGATAANPSPSPLPRQASNLGKRLQGRRGSRDSGSTLRSSQSAKSRTSRVSDVKKNDDGNTNTNTKRFTTAASWIIPKMTCFGKLQNSSRALTGNPRFSILTAVLTLYALFGDDFRLAATSKSSDIVFDIMTIFCVLIFLVEVIACCLGQKDYFLGFFFTLDAVSTITLVFDLTWISNSLFCSTMNAETALKTSRAGRVGARASRTMRIIRLMRMVKLYKTYRTATVRSETIENLGEQTEEVKVSPGTEIEPMTLFRDATGELVDTTHKRHTIQSRASVESLESCASRGRLPVSEMRVGRKLSDMTTRRVIGIVLVMLFILPWCTPAQHGRADFLYSAKFAAETFFMWLRSWCRTADRSSYLDGLPWCLRGLDTSAAGNILVSSGQRRSMENNMLAYIRHHRGDPDFTWKLFWVGYSSHSLGHSEAADSTVGRLAQLNEAYFLGNLTLSETELTARLTEDLLSEPKPVPASVVERLTAPWQESCKGIIGVNVEIADLADDHSAVASSCSIEAELRCSEVEYITPDALSDDEAEFLVPWFVFDKRGFTMSEAAISIAQTFFICLVVGLGALSFTKDANEILLDPIERMMTKVQVIKENPLAAIRLGDMEYNDMEKEEEKQRTKLARMGAFAKLWLHYREKWFRQKEPMETVMLERTIIKLGRLLALGFGEAGAAILANVLQPKSNTLRDLGPGEPVEIIIGFCRIRRFVEVMEALETNVTIFVNQVCEIVHGCVDDFYGAPIMNTGDAFLVIWQLASIVSPRKKTKMADMALMSFIRIVTEVNRSRILARWRSHPALLQRHKNFRVELSFGLHRGRAIEGMIGSECKIDPSYLSPSVSLVPKLEAATEHFGVWMLVTEPLMTSCSKEMQSLSRIIDNVTLQGGKQPLRLYTIDLDHSKVQVDWAKPESVILNPFKVRQLREIKKQQKWGGDYSIASAFDTDEDLKAMRTGYSPQFFRRFRMAYRNYEEGEWRAARDMFFTCHYQPRPNTGKFMVNGKADWPEDGPTVALLRFMRQSHYTPPNGWPGYRQLL